jgi:response regulator RpfG family c-di-GMP phosphodiesterase
MKMSADFQKAGMKDFDHFLRSYSYDPLVFAPLHEHAKKLIESYDPKYGPYLRDHLTRTSSNLYKFLKYSGYDEVTARKAESAFSLHDCGKLLQDVSLWPLTEEKPSFTDDQKAERRKHTALFSFFIEEALQTLNMKLSENDRQHIEAMKIMALCHHEQIDGKGPHGISAHELGRIMNAAICLDTFDGKGKTTATLEERMADLIGKKHEDHLDRAIALDVVAFLRGGHGLISVHQRGIETPALS